MRENHITQKKNNWIIPESMWSNGWPLEKNRILLYFIRSYNPIEFLCRPDLVGNYRALQKALIQGSD